MLGLNLSLCLCLCICDCSLIVLVAILIKNLPLLTLVCPVPLIVCEMTEIMLCAVPMGEKLCAVPTG